MFNIGATVKHAGEYAVIRFVFKYANGLMLLDTNLGTFDARDCVLAES